MPIHIADLFKLTVCSHFHHKDKKRLVAPSYMGRYISIYKIIDGANRDTKKRQQKGDKHKKSLF